MIELHEIVCQIERLCQEMEIAHRFVGGVAYSGLLTSETSFKVSVPTKTVRLKNHRELPVFRDDGTVRDIDLVTFCPDPEKIAQLKKMISSQAVISGLGDKYPFVSVENAVFNNDKKHNKIFQFVYSVFIDGEDFGKGRVYLVYENIREEISWKSLEAWTIVLQDGKKYTVRNPYGDLLGYLVRTPIGFKPKDREKLALMEPLVDETIELGKKQGVDYFGDDYYGPWLNFFQKMATAGGTVGLKREIIKTYWDIFGTKLAHGKGPVAKVISRLGNQFTGIKQ
jgi:hypothetical protein